MKGKKLFKRMMYAGVLVSYNYYLVCNVPK